MQQYLKQRDELGFTLIELLIAIVVVGILAAVAILGISGLTNNGSKSACLVTADAAKAASAVYFTNNNSTYPSDFLAMTSATPPLLELQNGVTPNPPAAGDKVLTFQGGKTLTMAGGGATPNTFTCSA